jgi:DNA invertase Pin-like site-specific DNA recombinase
MPIEDIEYIDEGCEQSPSCLHCPLPQCIYDEPRIAKKLRDNHIRKLFEEGEGIEGLANKFGVSKRTIYRIVKGR